jgi:hypothetical protein
MKYVASLIAGLFMAGVAEAGVYVEIVDRDIPTNKSELAQKMYVQGGNGRFVDSEGHASIIKGDVMYIVNDEDRSYTVLDKATIEAMGKKMTAVIDQAKQQLAKLPPEQRAQMEAMLGKQIPALAGGMKRTVDVTDTGKSEKVDGRTCRVWDVKRGGELDEQICVVSFAQLPGKEDFQAVFRRFAAIFEDIAKSVPDLAGMMNSEYETLNKINGFPVRSRDYEEGKLGDSEHLVKVWREEPIPASMFEVPAGYRQEQMPVGLQ